MSLAKYQDQPRHYNERHYMSIITYDDDGDDGSDGDDDGDDGNGGGEDDVDDDGNG